MREETDWRTAALTHRVCPEQQKGGCRTDVHELLVMAIAGRVERFLGWQEDNFINTFKSSLVLS